MFSYLIFVANPVLLIKGKIFISFNTIILLFLLSIFFLLFKSFLYVSISDIF